MSKVLNPDEIGEVVKSSFGPDYRVIDYKIANFSNDKLGFLGAHKSLEITCDKNGKEPKTKKFFVKTIPIDSSEEHKEFVKSSGVFDQESEYFNKLLPELKKSCDCEEFSPRFYLGNSQVIVLEDLRNQGYQMRKDKLLNLESLKAAARTMARLHAASILTEARLGGSLKDLFPNALTERLFSPMALEYQLDVLLVDLATQIAKKHNKPYHRFSSAFWKVYNRVNDVNGKNRVVCHGDCYANNLMYNDDTEPAKCIFIDYQLCRWAERTFDLAHLIYLTTGRQFREKHEETILRTYQQELADIITRNDSSLKVPTFAEIAEEYEENRVCGQILALFDYPIIFLNQDLINEFEKDPDYHQNFIFRENNDCVIEQADRDKEYGRRLTEVVIEFSEHCEKLQLPEN